MNYHLSTETHDPDWDAFVALSPWGHLLQSCAWGGFKAEFGWQLLRVVGERHGQIVCGAQALARSTPAGPVVYVPRGPVLAPDDGALPALLATLGDAARDRGAVFLKIEPGWADDPVLAGHLESMGFRRSARSIQPRTTIVLDLRPDEADILMGMKPKWRYNIRLATRKNVEVRRGGADDLPAFYELMQLTSERDRFAVHQRGYYEAAWRCFHSRGQAELLLAAYENELLAGLMVFRAGDTACYLYGGSSNRHRNRMPNHLLQWRAIQWAKAHGCTRYDFWGVPDQAGEGRGQAGDGDAQADGGMWGVYRFKQGFGGEIVRTVGSFDHVFRPARYWLGTRLWPLIRGRL